MYVDITIENMFLFCFASIVRLQQRAQKLQKLKLKNCCIKIFFKKYIGFAKVHLTDLSCN